MADTPYRYDAQTGYDDPSRYELPAGFRGSGYAGGYPGADPGLGSPAYGGAEDWGRTTSVRSSGASDAAGASRPGGAQLPPELDPRRGRTEHGLTGPAALLVLVVIAGIGVAFDSLASMHGGFNIAIIVASIVAIVLVRRSAMFPVVVAPPIVYSAASAAMLYVRSNGLSDHKALYDAASNWLVYGFPAVAGATAAVLIIGGIRLVSHR